MVEPYTCSLGITPSSLHPLTGRSSGYYSSRRPRGAGRSSASPAPRSVELAVHGAAELAPEVVRQAEAEAGLPLDDVRVAASALAPLRLPEQREVVLLRPDDDQVGGGRELGDEAAPLGRTREGACAEAEPTGIVRLVVGGTVLLDGAVKVDARDRRDVLLDQDHATPRPRCR